MFVILLFILLFIVIASFYYEVVYIRGIFIPFFLFVSLYYLIFHGFFRITQNQAYLIFPLVSKFRKKLFCSPFGSSAFNLPGIFLRHDFRPFRRALRPFDRQRH